MVTVHIFVCLHLKSHQTQPRHLVFDIDKKESVKSIGHVSIKYITEGQEKIKRVQIKSYSTLNKRQEIELECQCMRLKFVETMRVMSYAMEASEIKARRLPF